MHYQSLELYLFLRHLLEKYNFQETTVITKPLLPKYFYSVLDVKSDLLKGLSNHQLLLWSNHPILTAHKHH